MAPARSTSDPSVKELVEENSRDQFLLACDILVKFATNVLQNPQEAKYRKIRLSNKHVSEKLLNVSGGFECLFAMGFVETEDGEFLTLPQNADLKKVEKIRKDLSMERGRLSVSGAARVRGSAFETTEKEFFDRLKSSMSRVMIYENSSAQAKARASIPIEQLEKEARDKLATLKAPAGTPALDLRDCLLMAMLRWFKQDFFRWVDTLPCHRCQGRTNHNGSAAPTQEDIRWGASRVEAHHCPRCNVATRFPRYTNAVKLLQTRQGRCGEWADCFTLCCRALGFEARYVLDWTDHVWTEVFSVSQQRWLHCDSCENICDKPLLYESGWGKKLSYVIAFSKDEVQDVSWRYSSKHSEMLSRRRLCRESWLRRTIHRLCKAKMTILPEARRAELWTRLIHELTEFLCVKTESGEVLPGRISGSLAWRQARGEVGDGNANNNTVFVFKATEAEVQSKVIEFCYMCAEDKYVRKSDNSAEVRGWEACGNSAYNVMRKEESDWRMCYLARLDGTKTGQIVWKFDVTDQNLKLKKLEVKAISAEFETGKVSWRICAGDVCAMHKGSEMTSTLTVDLAGSTSLELTAVMAGGRGDAAWQHGQLFRQSSDARGEPGLEVKVFLE